MSFWVTATPATVAEITLDPAAVELRVPVATPLLLVVAAGCVSVLPLPVAARTTAAPAIGLPNPSFAVTVTVETDDPLLAMMEAGEATTVDSEADTLPGVTVTPAVSVIATPSIVADTVLVSGTVELSVPVATPLAFVTAPGWVSVLPVPVATNTTVAPAIGLPKASRAVTVMVDFTLPELAAMLAGETLTVD